MINVLLVDDQALVRKGLQRLLSQQAGIAVIGECSDGDQVLETTIRLQPDIVLMDVRMKRTDGIVATKALQQLASPPPVAILTTFGDEDILWNALAAGAAGYILKDASTDDLVRAINVVSAGGAWLDTAITPKVIEHFKKQNPTQSPHNELVNPLTAREQEVLVLIAEGLLNHEIANKLFVSEATIKTHISHIFSKLGARDRAAAIVYAYENNIVVPNSNQH